MIRDLFYPEDAEKVYAALVKGLEYDAAIAIFGNSAGFLTELGDRPDFSTGIRFGGKEADLAVRRDSSVLFSRFALLSMISRVEEFNRLLLLQRYVLDELKGVGQKMTGSKMWTILQKVYKDIRSKSASEVVTQLLVNNPSRELVERAGWLNGLVKVRNCIAHRLGKVQIDDVKESGTQIDTVKDSDVLKVKWVRIKASLAGEEIKDFPYRTENGGQLNVNFEEYEKSWKIGETIRITPLECQGIAFSLASLGSIVLLEFKIEMNLLLGVK